MKDKDEKRMNKKWGMIDRWRNKEKFEWNKEEI